MTSHFAALQSFKETSARALGLVSSMFLFAMFVIPYSLAYRLFHREEDRAFWGASRESYWRPAQPFDRESFTHPW